MTINDLKAADWNPRAINEREFELLKNSLLDFGDLSGIIYNRTTGNLIGGHQRIKAFKELAPETKVVITDTLDSSQESKTRAYGYFEVKGDRFAYREVEWLPEREKLANIAANNISGQWETDKLGEILQNLAQNAENIADLQSTGFSQELLTDFLDNGSDLKNLIALDIMNRYDSEPFDYPDEAEENISISEDEESISDYELDENLETKNRCPSCGYEFN